MKRTNRSVMMLGMALLLAAAGTAQADGIQLGLPAYGGTGCPSGSASATLSPDQKELSILFDQFVVEAGGTSGKRVDRKNCSIAIPVHVPQGYSVSVFQVDYRGFNSLPRNATSQFNVEYFFAGERGPRYTRQWRGDLNEDYTVTNAVGAEALVWSACGAETILRANTNMMVQTNPRNEQALATVDSADIKAGLIYHLQWKRCF